MAHFCDLSTWKAEAGGKHQGWRASLGYVYSETVSERQKYYLNGASVFSRSAPAPLHVWRERSWALGEAISGLALLGLCFAVSSDMTVPQEGILFALTWADLCAICTYDHVWTCHQALSSSSTRLWKLNFNVSFGTFCEDRLPTVSRGFWFVLWVVWLCIHAAQHANGDFFSESRVVVWKLNMASNQKKKKRFS